MIPLVIKSRLLDILIINEQNEIKKLVGILLFVTRCKNTLLISVQYCRLYQRTAWEYNNWSKNKGNGTEKKLRKHLKQFATTTANGGISKT